MPTILTEIEIAAPPATVRSVFLDFPSWKNWNEAYGPSTLDADKQAKDLRPGDRMKMDLKGFVFRPDIIENSEEAFQWCGNGYGIFTGTHQFHFTPSKKTPGHTTLTNREDFSGLLSIFMRPGWNQAQKTQDAFNQLNRDIKAEAEKRATS